MVIFQPFSENITKILMTDIYLPAKAFAVDYVLVLRGIFSSLKSKSSLAKIRFCGVNF